MTTPRGRITQHNDEQTGETRLRCECGWSSGPVAIASRDDLEVLVGEHRDDGCESGWYVERDVIGDDDDDEF